MARRPDARAGLVFPVLPAARHLPAGAALGNAGPVPVADALEPYDDQALELTEDQESSAFGVGVNSCKIS